MRRTFKVMTTMLALALAGPLVAQDSADSVGSEVDTTIEQVGYQTYLGDARSPTKAKSVSSARATFSAGPVAAIGSGCSAGCTAGCTACTAKPAGCAAPAGCGVDPTCAANDCTAPGCGAGSWMGPDCIPCSVGLFYGGAEYLLWWNDARFLPPIATVGTAANLGRLPGAAIIFGNDDVGGKQISGGRVTLGKWSDPSENSGFIGRFYANGGETNRFSATSAQFPAGILARPFFNNDPLVNGQDALLIGVPVGTPQVLPRTGNISALASNDILGTDVSLRTLLDGDAQYRIDLITGFQYNRIDDDLIVRSNITLQNGNTIAMTDIFDAENDYYAGTLGLMGEFNRGIFTVTTLGRIGMGNMRERVQISGSNTVTVVGGGATTTAGGLLAQPTNIGTRSQDTFAFSPEAGLNLSVAITQNMDFTIGYSFLYWNKVALAGGLIDPRVNGTQLLGANRVGPATPAFTFADDSFWAHALSLGASFRY